MYFFSPMYGHWRDFQLGKKMGILQAMKSKRR